LLTRFATTFIALTCWGCSLLSASSPASTAYVPSTAGLVNDVESVGPDMRFILEDGRVFTFPANGNYIGGSQPRIGGILLAGTQPVSWAYWADLRAPSPNLTPEGCYIVFGRATMNATHVFQTVSDPRGNVIMVFPKRADWTDVGVEDGTDQLIGVGTCINPQGRAFHFGF
jgi:hypothetical protein